MKGIRILLLLLMISFNTGAKVRVTDIRCENLLNPLGIDKLQPNFNWKLISDQRGVFQTAYQVAVATTPEKLKEGKPDLWDSEKVESGQNTFITYNGKPLSSAIKYYWRVKIWDQEGKPTPWSEPSFFVTGIYNHAEWMKADWIGYENLPDSLRITRGKGGIREDSLGNIAKKRSVVSYFRKSFTTNKKVKEAFVFVSGLGHYELFVNGEKTGNYFLAPGWTQYTKQCFYNTYEVTDHLKKGENVIGAIVGNGFFYINRERYRKTAIAVGYPMLRLKMIIRYDDGTLEEISSGADWKTTPSPITYSSIYGGEDYDARLEQKGWNNAGFNASGWKNALLVKGPGGKMDAQKDMPLQVMETFSPQKILQPKPGVFVYDFGQNASGIVRISVKGKKGDVVKITPAELLGEDSLANQTASGSPYYFSYTLKGDGVEEWEPKFTYYGLRYAQIEGAVPKGQSTGGREAEIMKVQLLHTRNSAPLVGSFECSNPLFNKIFELINWGIKSNMASVATDCPHREKLGWLEETHLVGSSIKYNFDILNFYNKIVEDMIYSQMPEGLVPDYVPEFNTSVGGFRDSPEWGSASIILPWYIYKWYGDKEVLVKSYDMMKRYVAYLGSKSKDHIVSHGLGDWFDLGPERPGPSQLTPIALTATSIYFYDADLLSEIAGILGKDQDAEKYSALARDIKNALNKKFFNPDSKVYATGSQTSYAMPLYFEMVEPQYRQAVMDNLVKSINDSGKALTAGDIGFRYLVRALEEGGASQLLYEMNNRDDVPGYGYQIKNGATALTESWAALKYVSNNHMMLGHLMEWFYSGLAGIRQQENDVGFNKILIDPQMVDGIDWVKSYYTTLNGKIEVNWRKEKGLLLINVVIPANSSALLVLPCSDPEKIKEDGKNVLKNMVIKPADSVKKVTLNLTSGKYQFSTPY